MYTRGLCDPLLLPCPLFGFLDVFLAVLYVHTRVRIIVHLLASHVVDGSGMGSVNRLRSIYLCAPRCQFHIFGTGSSDVGQELFVSVEPGISSRSQNSPCIDITLPMVFPIPHYQWPAGHVLRSSAHLFPTYIG